MTDIQQAVDQLDTEILLIHELIGALIATHPTPEAVLSKFQTGVESLVKFAPNEVDQEKLVELRARSKQHLIVLRKQIAARGPR